MIRPQVVLSPHFDDAVLSACSRLIERDCDIVTVFSAAPPTDIDVTSWDQLTGAVSSARRHMERLLEDDAALALVGCSGGRLGHLESEFRSDSASLDAIHRGVAGVCADRTEIFLPAAVGGHPDHRIVRDAGLASGPVRSGSATAYLYADQPYAILYGWPSWVTGRPCSEYLNVDFWLEDDLRQNGLDPASLEPRAITLTAEQRALKEAAVACYRSQLLALGLNAGEPRWDDVMSYEVIWRYDPSPEL